MIQEDTPGEAGLVGQFAPIPLPMDRLAKIYVKIRTAERDLTSTYEAKLAELEEQKKIVANSMKEQLMASGGTSMRTDHGTVVLITKTRYWTQDWEAFEEFCITQGTIGFLEKRIAQGNMTKFLQDNPGTVPPGLNSEQEYVISVRKSG